MARAELKKQKVKTVVRPGEVILKLTLPEAIALRAVVGLITGCAESSGRKLTDNIYTVLNDCGLFFTYNILENSAMTFMDGSLDVINKSVELYEEQE